jgi:zinc transporter, ZIP family
MAGWFLALDPITQAFVATLGTYLLTAVGTTPVLFFRTAPRRLMDALMGGAAGVMVAAACWSLLQPAIEMAGPWPAVVGLIAGGLFIFALDQLLPHLHPEFPDEATQEGPQSSYRRASC